jgi:hypothetical protein
MHELVIVCVRKRSWPILKHAHGSKTSALPELKIMHTSDGDRTQNPYNESSVLLLDHHAPLKCKVFAVF